MVKNSPRLCIICKGHRLLCGLSKCPFLTSYVKRVSIASKIMDKVIDGSTPPNVIVGESGYPYTSIYLGLPPGVYGDEAKLFDDPYSWHLKLGLEDIIEIRSGMAMLILPRIYVKDFEKLYESEVGLAAVSLKPVDAEGVVSKVLKTDMEFDYILPPTGPRILARDVKVVGDLKIPRKLEEMVFEDVKALEAIEELYRYGVDFYTIVRALSIGFLGYRNRRRIVPTRWAITAVDSSIGKSLLDAIKLYPEASETLVFYSEYLYNKYLVILSPGPYKAMWIEAWHPKAIYNPSKDIQWLEVRETKPNIFTAMDGGFIAARTSVLEYLYTAKRQAKVAILREILPQYIYPVGSWQIRQTVKHALTKGPILKNPSEEELRIFIEKSMNIPREAIEKAIEFIYEKKQLKLDRFSIKFK